MDEVRHSKVGLRCVDLGQTLLRSDVDLLPDRRREAYRVLLNPADKMFMHLDESEVGVYSSSAYQADQWCELLRFPVTSRDLTRPEFVSFSRFWMDAPPEAVVAVISTTLKPGTPGETCD
jgi:hypothetical protein